MSKHTWSAACLVFAGFVVGVSAAHAQPSPASSSTLQTEIRAAADAFVKSFNQKDAAAIAALASICHNRRAP